MVHELAFSTTALLEFSKGTAKLNFPLSIRQSLYNTFINCVSVQSFVHPGTTYYLTSSASTYKANDGQVHPNILANFVSSSTLFHFPCRLLCSLTVIPETLIFHVSKLKKNEFGNTYMSIDDTYSGHVLVQLNGFKV